ncbi:cytokinin riboside 5'-monophosphate phosphoribohydrolase LOG7-like protein [Tanacetum coccineum]
MTYFVDHVLPVGLLNVKGYYKSLLIFIDKAVDEGFISPTARGIIVPAPNAKQLARDLEVQGIENEAKAEIFRLDSIKFAHFSKSRRNPRKATSIPLDRARKNESNSPDFAPKLDTVPFYGPNNIVKY